MVKQEKIKKIKKITGKLWQLTKYQLQEVEYTVNRYLQSKENIDESQIKMNFNHNEETCDIGDKYELDHDGGMT